jgi:ATP-binding cassette subfamily F protein 3
MYSCPDADRQTARNICGAMMFEQDAALKKISVLSGGEKSRVMLGKLLMTPLNLLLLDEPSNHLDIESCDAFVCALDAFKGAVVIVTHNEMFLHCLANRLVVFKNDRVEVFEGSYQEFLDKEGWDEQVEAMDPPLKASGVSKKELRRKKSEIITQKSRKIKPVRQKIEDLENDIEKNEGLITGLNHQLLEASQSQDGSKIQALSKELAKLETMNETLFDDLEIQMDLFEKIEKIFDHQLSEIER